MNNNNNTWNNVEKLQLQTGAKIQKLLPFQKSNVEFIYGEQEKKGRMEVENQLHYQNLIHRMNFDLTTSISLQIQNTSDRR